MHPRWVHLELDVRVFDPSDFTRRVDAVRAGGIRVVTLAHLGDTDAHRHLLYELNAECSADISDRGLFHTWDEYRRLRLDVPAFDPRGVVIALDGERWVGMSATSDHRQHGYVFNEMTGVVRSHRARGIAMAMKVTGVDFATECRVERVRTVHHSDNATMVALNRRLGYRDAVFTHPCLDTHAATCGASPEGLATPLIERLRAECARRSHSIFVALDGRSGAGKSTVAAVVAERFAMQTATSPVTVAVIEGDQFYSGGRAERWDDRPTAELVDRVIDWRQQRTVLEQLRSCGEATWSPFDWTAEYRDSDDIRLRGAPIRSTIATVVILEGAYSARPELHDLLDLRVLIDIPADVRRRQLLEREGEEYRSAWEARWSAAEEHYFATVMPPGRFDLVLG